MQCFTPAKADGDAQDVDLAQDLVHLVQRLCVGSHTGDIRKARLHEDAFNIALTPPGRNLP